MRFWYSANAKKFFRANYTSYNSTDLYYGAVTDGTDFKATDGSTGRYLQSSSYATNSSYNTWAGAICAVESVLCPLYYHNSTAANYNRIYLCLDTDTFDDTKYTTSGQISISDYSLSLSRSMPGYTVLTITNSGTDSITFNALEYVTGTTGSYYWYLSTDNNTRGTSKSFLMYAIILDEAVTVPAGGTYSVTFSV